ncbi:MAG: hypothetical protein M1823_005793 [Watsoniomyces obsoletus]|nr:MAG: hypothetical protein M1823_005793 [Watsoniomyces obsoletus]
MHLLFLGCLLSIVTTSVNVVAGAALFPRRARSYDEETPYDDTKIAIDKNVLKVGGGLTAASLIGLAVNNVRLRGQKEKIFADSQSEIADYRARLGYPSSPKLKMSDTPRADQVLELSPYERAVYDSIQHFEIDIIRDGGDREAEEMYWECKKKNGVDTHLDMHMKFQNQIKLKCINDVKLALLEKRNPSMRTTRRIRYPDPNLTPEEQQQQQSQNPDGKRTNPGETPTSFSKAREAINRLPAMMASTLQQPQPQLHLPSFNPAALAAVAKNFKVKPVPVKGLVI